MSGTIPVNWEQFFEDLVSRVGTLERRSTGILGATITDSDSDDGPVRFPLPPGSGGEIVTDGEKPDESPQPTLTGGIGVVFVTYPEVENRDDTIIDIFASTDSPVNIDRVPDVSVRAASGPGLVPLRVVEGAQVQPGTSYYVVTVARDGDGAALPSEEAVGTPLQVDEENLAVGSLTAAHLTANTALIEALAVVGLNAQWINAGQLNVDRLSVGSTPTSVMPNANMEDPLVDEDGTIHADQFAGWVLGPGAAGGGVISAETANPLSGSRSLKVTTASSTATQRILSRTAIPVAGNQSWSVTAKARINRSISHASSGAALATVFFQTAVSEADPGDQENGSTIVWQAVDAVDVSVAGETINFTGEVLVPAGHRQMRLGLMSHAAADGSGYEIVWDEVSVVRSVSEIVITNPATRQVMARITEEGDITGHDLVTTGTLFLNPERTDVGGRTLKSVLDGAAGSAKAYGQRNFDQLYVADGGEINLMRLDLELKEPRALRFLVNGSMLSPAGTTPLCTQTIRYTYSPTGVPAAPDRNSTALAYNVNKYGGNGAAETMTQDVIASMPAGFYRFFYGFNATQGDARAFSSCAAHILDAGPGLANTGYWSEGEGGFPPPPPQTYVSTWDATYAQWWNSDNVPQGGDTLYFGNASSGGGGNRKAAIWFPAGLIRPALAGAQVLAVELFMYLDNGGKGNSVGIGLHNEVNARNDWLGIAGKQLNLGQSTNWNEGTGRWVNISGMDPQGWASYLGGVTVGPGLSGADVYAGGVADYRRQNAVQPKLRITYRR